MLKYYVIPTPTNNPHYQSMLRFIVLENKYESAIAYCILESEANEIADLLNLSEVFKNHLKQIRTSEG